MLLQKKITTITKKFNSTSKSLSGILRRSHTFNDLYSQKQNNAKALKHIHLKGVLTVEAAFVLPVIVFLLAFMMSILPVIQLQIQINESMQYAARIMAVSYRDKEEVKKILSLAEGEALFWIDLNRQGYKDTVVGKRLGYVSFIKSDLTGEYVTLIADYHLKLPISLGKINTLPVRQIVRTKKWTGRSEIDERTDSDYVYITPSGEAYHTSAECSYLNLSIRGMTVSEIAGQRNRQGGKYYPCSCYHNQSMAFITDYGDHYHGNIGCTGLKRTIYRVTKEGVGSRHACHKCS